MKKLNELSLVEIDRELAWRQKVLPELVGNLYPDIIRQQISELRTRQHEIKAVLKREGYDDNTNVLEMRERHH